MITCHECVIPLIMSPACPAHWIEGVLTRVVIKTVLVKTCPKCGEQWFSGEDFKAMDAFFGTTDKDE